MVRGVRLLAVGSRRATVHSGACTGHLVTVYGPEAVVDHPGEPPVFDFPGVVLIDEVDSHLHPEWQRQIGFWLKRHFPKMQFIVTTHSPLICQAADVKGLFHLPAPGA